MTRKRGLGKGLDALIPAVNSEEKLTVENNNFSLISVASIYPNPRQARYSFKTEKLDELINSIQEHGVVQPIIVRSIPNGNYELIAGERRWRACKKLGLEQIPAVIKTYSDVEASAVSLIENIQRENLNSLEEAAAYKKLMDSFGLTQEEVAGQVGKSRSFVANLLRLLSLTPEVKEMLLKNIITTGHAKALLALDEPEIQKQVAEKIAANNLSVRDTEKLIKDLLHRNELQKQVKEKDKYFVVLENKLNNLLKTMVNIKINKSGRGKIEIVYKDHNDLERIFDLLNKNLTSG